jgi:hypothetical protein
MVKYNITLHKANHGPSPCDIVTSEVNMKVNMNNIVTA